MPYIKKDKDKLKMLLLGNEVNIKTLAEMLNVSRGTASARMKAPETLTVEELRIISRNAHIPIEDIRSAI